MAQFFKAKKPVGKSNRVIDINIEQFNHDGQGIGYTDNKICFVQGALPGERVKATVVEDKAKLLKARCNKVIEASEHRIKPECQHFEQCGGCQMQYANRDYQLQLKRQAVSDLFKRFSNIDSLPWQESLTANPWHYRRAARIGVWYDSKKLQFTVGFRQQNSKFLTPIKYCAVLDEAFKNLFSAFAQILEKLKVGRYITHLEVLKADNANAVVIRHTQAMPKADKAKLAALGQENDWLMVSEFEKGEFECLGSDPLPQLHYVLPDFGSKLTFRIGDFIQINADINQQMVKQAQQWLALEKTDNLLDLFCGIGNFSLPLARMCASVTGIEGVDAMVTQATDNGVLNELDNVEFYQADLSADWSKAKPRWLQQAYNKVLLDPARAGAGEILTQLGALKPQKILYVSCEPLTLARDSSVLTDAGYQITKIALMDMFSQTRHVEVMALFEHKKG
jgi:23S rRNA (uracil1939-C5)-methyltransferase